MGIARQRGRMMRSLCLLAVMAVAMAQDDGNVAPAGGDNLAIPLAKLPMPADKCSVSVSNDADMRLSAVAWGYDNAYWMVKQDRDWGEVKDKWVRLGGFFAGGPTVVRNANNDLVIFGRGADRKLWYRVLNQGEPSAENEDSWTCLEGKSLSSRPTAWVDPQGLIHLVYQGIDNQAYEKRQFANGTEAVWGEWTSLGGVFSNTPNVVVDPEGITHLFARGIDGGMWHMTQKVEEDGSLTWKGCRCQRAPLTCLHAPPLSPASMPKASSKSSCGVATSRS